METPEHQEWRSRQALSIPAVIKAGLGTGLIFFMMSGGTPWSTAGTANAAMGRDFAWNIFAVGALHFGLALGYMLAIAAVIYRMGTGAGIATGVALSIALYVVNLLVFQASGLMQQSPEFRPFFVHLMFGIFASLLYKAVSVPRPLAE